MADLLVDERMTIWYSGPAILSLLGQLDDLESRDLTSLRAIAFAGEAFPPPKLRPSAADSPTRATSTSMGPRRRTLPPTTSYPPSSTSTGRPRSAAPASTTSARIVDDDGRIVSTGTPGELQLRGGGLDTGYWNDPELSTRQLIADPGGEPPWFRTGDRVAQVTDGTLRHRGRIDRMVKLRGYRVEPGEIEARLYEHPRVKEVGVVPADGPDGLELVAHLSTSTADRLPIVELKEFCAVKLPPYMIPARFVFHRALPRTSTGKIDIQTLRVPA